MNVEVTTGQLNLCTMNAIQITHESSDILSFEK